MPDVPAAAVPAPHRRPHGSGFWAVAFAFLIVMAVATLPSPLYGLYRTRDHLSALTITVVFAIFAGGTIAMLLRDSSVAARIGRRGMMLGAVATMMRGHGGARGVEGPARAADRAADHRGVGRAGRGYRDHLPHRVAAARGSEGVGRPRPGPSARQ